MANETVRLTATIAASPERIWAAWLSSEEQSAFTGARAVIDPSPGGAYTAYDGYMRGITLETVPHRRIVQTFRTDDFPGDVGDSKVILELEPGDGGTRVVLVNEDLPPGFGERFEKGWREFYLEPLRRHLEAPVVEVIPPPAPTAKPKAPRRAAKAVKKPRAQRTSRKPGARKPASSRSGSRKTASSRKPARGTRVPSRKVKTASRTVKRPVAGKAARTSKPSPRKSPPRKPTRRKR